MTSIRLWSFGHDKQLRRLEVEACVAGFVDGKEPFTMFDTAAGGKRVEGIEIRNVRTGNVARFLFTRRTYKQDGSVMAWHFKPHPSAIASHPALAGYEAVIVND